MSLGRPGYYDPNSSPLTLTPFPLSPRWGSNDQMVTVEDVYGETASGQPWDRKLFARRHWSLLFRTADDEHITFFRNLHEAVGGQEQPFIFVEDVNASPFVTHLVRKEPDFAPQSQKTLKKQGVQIYDYTLQLTLELKRMKLVLVLGGFIFGGNIIGGTRYDDISQALLDALNVSPAPMVTGIDEFGNIYSLPVIYLVLSGEVFALPGGTPLSALFGRGWVAGQMDTLRNAGITPFLLPGSADFYEWYGV